MEVPGLGRNVYSNKYSKKVDKVDKTKFEIVRENGEREKKNREKTDALEENYEEVSENDSGESLNIKL